MTYTSKRPPREHQVRALEAIDGKDSFALLMAMRCVDSETEYLSPTGWRKISKYSGGKVAEFRLDGTAHFVDPIEYVKAPVDSFWRFKTYGGVDQVLSLDHRILVQSSRKGHYGKYVGEVPFENSGKSNWIETSPRELMEIGYKTTNYGNKLSKNRWYFPTTFQMKNESHLELSDDEIRVMVAFHADGCLSSNKGIIRVKKQHKKERIRELLTAAGITWTEHQTESDKDYTRFRFDPPRMTKTYGEEWWFASYEQKKVICDEVWRWDGGRKNAEAMTYSTTIEADADFVQYCFSSTGTRCSKRHSIHKRTGRDMYFLHATGTGRTTNLALVPWPEEYHDHDGYMYSFSVPSTYLVFRRNGKVFVSGNTGKSKVIVDDFGRLASRREADDLLVIAPAGAYMPWATAVKDDLGIPSETFVWVSKRSKNKSFQGSLEAFLTDLTRSRVLVVNIEAVSSVKSARDLCEKFLSQRRCVLVIDESVIIKNKDSKASKFCVDVLSKKASHKRILSGLVAPRAPLDVYQQFRFLDPSIFPEPWEQFRSRYAIVERICTLPTRVVKAKFEHALGLNRPVSDEQIFLKYRLVFPEGDLPTPEMARFILQGEVDKKDMIEAIFRAGRYIPSIPMVKGYRNVEELHSRIAPYSFRVKLEDCTDLPPSDYSFRDILMTQEQEKVYYDMLEFARAQLKDSEYVTAANVVTQMLRLHQVLCGHVMDDDGTVHEISENRTDSLVELLSDYDGKAIIWCSYDADVRKVSARLMKTFGGDSVARFWGGNRKTREEEEAEFKTSNTCRFMVATPDAGGRGRTWDCADLVIYYSSRNNLDHRAQSEERAKNVGKTRPVAYVDFRVPGTVEDKIIEALRNKIDLASVISGDDYMSWLV